ncbi:MAG: aminodeoxychorismate lyase [Phenylobacterium sp.]|uniref:aminotransferase class IV n=1 Tax=Phenylobacterium sp. TaxID=1871053 RepID=UPI0027354EAE|nr:aminodeoxychorismate lyase [Phenylobacterium sp.]MDP3746450.1 aminodeoxychorismate lyase [Phenylobacterium sp.]
MIPFDDRGLLLGDGLFETLLARDGVLVDLEAHLDRLAAGCATLGLPTPDRGEAERLMRQAIEGVEAPRAAVRLTLTAGSGGRGLDRPEEPVPRLFASAAPSAVPEGPARLILSTVRRNEGSPASRLKTLAYLDNVLARQEARARGANEAVMLNNRGEVACAAAANLFWVREGRLFTPALTCGVLAGVMRARVIAAAAGLGVEVAETAAEPGELDAAEAVFLTNSLVGLREVAALDAVAYGPSRLAERLARALD